MDEDLRSLAGMLIRIEAKVDALIVAFGVLVAKIAEDDEEPPAVDLEGQPAGEERDLNQPL